MADKKPAAGGASGAGGAENVCVCVRLRCTPPADGCITADSIGNTIVSKDQGNGEEEFAFDHVFDGFSNYAVYGIVGRRVIQNIFGGFNTCVFAYGQTGSGKTHTMLGPPRDPGVIPRLCQHLFAEIEDQRSKAETGVELRTEVIVQYMEIYNEQIRDLFRASDKSYSDKLRIREDPKKGVFVEGLTMKEAQSAEEISQMMDEGNKERTTACTNMNSVSSRSHALFVIRFKQSVYSVDEKTGDESVTSEKSSIINLVDLAGSERLKRTGAEGQQMKEAQAINGSLSKLGKVIAKLADPKARAEHVPYRESKLTWLLRESLGGNSRTIMIAAVSPMEPDGPETVNTLRYAAQCKKIVNNVVMNEDRNAKMIRVLQEELQQLREQLSQRDAVASEELQAALAKQMALTQEEIEAHKAVFQKEKEEETKKSAREATQAMLEEMEQMKRTHEASYEELKLKLKREMAEEVKAASERKEVEGDLRVAEEKARELAEQTKALAEQSQEKEVEKERLRREVKEKEDELVASRREAMEKADELIAFKQMQEEEREEAEHLKKKVAILESLLDDRQRELYLQRLFNGDSDGNEIATQTQGTMPRAATPPPMQHVSSSSSSNAPASLPPRVSEPMHDQLPPDMGFGEEGGFDDMAIVRHQQMLLEEARRKKEERDITLAQTITAESQVRQGGTHVATSSGNDLRSPHSSSNSASTLPASAQSPQSPAQSNWDLINQRLIDMGVEEEIRAEILCSEIDINDESAVFDMVERINEQRRIWENAKTGQTHTQPPPSAYVNSQASPPSHVGGTRPRTPPPPSPPHHHPAHTSPIWPATAAPTSPPQFMRSPGGSTTVSPMAQTIHVRTMKPNEAKTELTKMVHRACSTGRDEVPMEVVQHVTAFVSANILTVKEALKSLKEPLKRDVTTQLIALNILDGAVMMGPLSIPTEVSTKKWMDRLNKIGSANPAVSARMQNLLNRWSNQFQATPALYSVFIKYHDRYYTANGPQR